MVMDPVSAEMVKYGSNAYLAARITFANTLANVCEAVDADVTAVLGAVGMDKRIGPHFLRPGPGFGGSCFPKDTQALLALVRGGGVRVPVARGGHSRRSGAAQPDRRQGEDGQSVATSAGGPSGCGVLRSRQEPTTSAPRPPST